MSAFQKAVSVKSLLIRASASSTASLTHFFSRLEASLNFERYNDLSMDDSSRDAPKPAARSELLNDAYTPPDKLVAERNRRPLA